MIHSTVSFKNYLEKSEVERKRALRKKRYRHQFKFCPLCGEVVDAHILRFHIRKEKILSELRDRNENQNYE